MSIGYKQTGKTYPVGIDEMLQHCKGKFMEYDQLAEGTGVKPDVSPYNGPIIYTTYEGKLVQIPFEIQKQALVEYKEELANGGLNMHMDMQQSFETPGFDPSDNYQNSSPLLSNQSNQSNQSNLVQELNTNNEYNNHSYHPVQYRRQKPTTVYVNKEKSGYNIQTWVLLGIAILVIFMFFKSRQ